MNNYGAVLSSNFMWIFLGIKKRRGGGGQIHIVQEHGGFVETEQNRK